MLRDNFIYLDQNEFPFTGTEDTCSGIARFACKGYYFEISVNLFPYFLYLF